MLTHPPAFAPIHPQPFISATWLYSLLVCPGCPVCPVSSEYHDHNGSLARVSGCFFGLGHPSQILNAPVYRPQPQGFFRNRKMVFSNDFLWYQYCFSWTCLLEGLKVLGDREITSILFRVGNSDTRVNSADA